MLTSESVWFRVVEVIDCFSRDSATGFDNICCVAVPSCGVELFSEVVCGRFEAPVKLFNELIIYWIFF